MSPTPETAAAVCAAATALAEAGVSVEEDRPAVLEQTADLANHLRERWARLGAPALRRLARWTCTLAGQRFDEAKALEVAELGHARRRGPVPQCYAWLHGTLRSDPVSYVCLSSPTPSPTDDRCDA